MAQRQDYDGNAGITARFNMQFSARASAKRSKELESFRNLLGPYLQNLEHQGQLENSEETLEIISAILEHHMIKASATRRN